MKVALAAVLIAATSPAIATAQDTPACYMQTAAGAVVNLNGLCGIGPQARTSAASTAVSASIQGKALSQGEIGQVVLTYVQEYCDNRTEGMSERRASAAANKAAIDWAFTLAKGVPANREQLIQELVRLTPAGIQQECPQFAKSRSY